MGILAGKNFPLASVVRRTADARATGEPSVPDSRIGYVKTVSLVLRLAEATSEEPVSDHEPVPADAAESASDLLSEVVAGAEEAALGVGRMLWSAFDASANAMVDVAGVVVSEVAGGAVEVAKVVGEAAFTAAGATVDLLLEA